MNNKLIMISVISLLFKILLLFAFLSTYADASSNYVSIDIEKLDYKKPDSNRGEAGNLIFPQVRLSWDEMKISLDNNSSFLDANIKVNPRYIKFKTSGLGFTFPLESESGFFKVNGATLENSSFILNQDFFNFSGEKFSVTNGTSKLILDKFNVYCNGEDDMTSGKGLIKGCLTDLILNGLNEGDLAGATIDYYDSTANGENIFLSSRLKSFELKSSKFKLDLNQAHLEVLNYNIDIGTADISCEKESKLYELDVDRLKNACVDKTEIHAPHIKIKDKETGSGFDISLEQLKTEKNSIEAVLPSVEINGEEGKTTKLSSIKIDCFKKENYEFYDLHKIISGCVENGQIDIDGISTVGAKTEQQFAKKLNVTFENNLVILDMKIKLPLIPQFKFNVEAYVRHDQDNKTLTFDIIRYKTIKILSWRYALRKALEFYVKGNDKMYMDDKKIVIQL